MGSTKIGVTKIWVEKCLGQKFKGGQKSLWVKKCKGKKILGVKKIQESTNFGSSKFFGDQKILGVKMFRGGGP